MRLKVCAGCVQPFPVEEIHRGKGRCSTCAKVKQRERDQRRGTASQRGYGAAWRRLRDSVIAAHPYCSAPGCGSTDNLSVDHIIPRSEGGTDDRSNLRVLCMEHNRSRPRHNAPQPRPRFSRKTLTGVESARGNDDAPSVA